MLGHYRRVLVIGAHPDDEDTELLTVLVRGMGAEAAYLSLNRGEGGQNGPSLEEADKRLSAPYMAESILAPGAQVAPQYRPWAIALRSGEVRELTRDELGGLLDLTGG